MCIRAGARAGARRRGSPNPYGVVALVGFVEALRRRRQPIDLLRQHEQSPCTRLFANAEDNRHSPGTILLYRALVFHPAHQQYAAASRLEVPWGGSERRG